MKTLTPILLLLLVLGLGCSNSTPVSTGANAAKTSPGSSPGIRRASVNKTHTFGKLSVTVGEIALEQGKITVGMTIKNDGAEKIMLYPDQGSAVIDKLQLKANMFLGEGDLSGDIFPGVEKQGSVVFLDDQKALDPAAVKKIDLKLGSALADKSFKSTDLSIFVDLSK